MKPKKIEGEGQLFNHQEIKASVFFPPKANREKKVTQMGSVLGRIKGESKKVEIPKLGKMRRQDICKSIQPA